MLRRRAQNHSLLKGSQSGCVRCLHYRHQRADASGGGRSPRRVRVCDLYTGRSYFSELFSLTDGQRDRAGRVLVMIRCVVELDVGDVGTARACGRSN